MAVALNTSKRKFYKILDNLTHPSSNPAPSAPTSTPSVAEPAPKRPRRSDASSTDGPLRHSPAPDPPAAPSTPRPASARYYAQQQPRPTSVRLVTSSAFNAAAAPAASPARPTPNYLPSSQPQFLARLKTFADVKLWTPKPDAVGEVEWAKRGWVCEAWNTVACKGGCGARVVVKLRPGRRDAEGREIERSEEVEGEVEEGLVERYVGLVVEGHGAGCLWRRAGCREDIYRIKMAEGAVWQTELKDRYNALLSVAPALPVHVRLPTGLDVEGLQRPLSRDGYASDPSSRTALALALFGWRGQEVSGLHLAHCDRCFQRVGLWLYGSAQAASPPRASDAAMTFDPVDLHREHCPWKNAASQCGVGGFRGLAGWQVLVELVKGSRQRREHEERESRVGEVAELGGGEGRSAVGEEEEMSREDIVAKDRERESRLARLKKAFSVKKGKRKPET